jgi:hypothetical protein
VNKWLTAILLIGAFHGIHGQITPPGMGDAKTGSWFALGLRQGLDTSNSKQSVTYVGWGTKSHPDNRNPFQKPGMFIANEEWYHQFHPHFQYTAALSYRRQYEYGDDPPYAPESPRLRQEIRVYGRFSYIWKSRRLRLALTFREDIRKFFTPDFRNWPETFQLRSRLRGQLGINIDPARVHRIILGAEALFPVSYNLPTSSWGIWGYKESRIACYYSVAPPDWHLSFNFGYMNNLLGTGTNLQSVHYLALDIILENPIGKKRVVVQDFSQ